MTQQADDGAKRFTATFAYPGAIAKSCPRCARAFGCGRDLPSCWCSELPQLPADQLDPASDCLCPDCLAALTAPAPAAGEP